MSIGAINAEPVNSKSPRPIYIPPARDLTPVQKKLVDIIPIYPASETASSLGKMLGITAASVNASLTTEFCIDYLICEDDEKNISRCQPVIYKGANYD